MASDDKYGKYSPRIKDVIRLSKEEASRLGNKSVAIEHLLLGILRDNEGPAIDALHKLNVDLKAVKMKIENQIREDNSVAIDENLCLDENAENVLKFANLEARKLGITDCWDTDHLLLAMLRNCADNSIVVDVLKSENVTYESLINIIDQHTSDVSSYSSNDDDEDDEDDFYDNTASDGDFDGGQNEEFVSRGSKEKGNSSTPSLDSFGTDMTREAELGKYDPMVGRNVEVERVLQILSRRKKNNPVLIGEPGVGKSAIVEGLAQRIVEKNVARVLFGKRIVSLDMSSIVAGTKFRGQFEERIKSILNELTKNPDVILFIDEIHTLVGAGNSQGGLDAANMLKPALARGTLQCIGATTLKEYRDSIEKDGALERRFQKIIVEPTTKDETLQILHNIKNRYEEHHCVQYTDDALVACVNLTDRYISDRAFPDKAIDALDEAGARKHVSGVSVPASIENLEKEIAQTQFEKNEAVKNQNYELAAGKRDVENKLTAQLEQERARWDYQQKHNPQVVDADDVRAVVSMMSGVPLQRIGKNEGEILVKLKDNLEGKVIGQDEAIEKVVKAIRRNRLGLKDPNRPIGSFLFLGPTGVGKTHLAQILAQEMFGSKDSLIRIDMSEYMEKIAITRLVGAAPGYVGHEEGGQLTEKVRRKPYCIVLLDEIEKAHHDVYNLLLQMLDEGRLTDSFGRCVDFKNTIIIMTSNVGSRQLKDFGTGIGFSTSSNEAMQAELARGVITKELNKTFSPEFLNRIDDIITFDQLSKESIEKIVELELTKVYERVESLGYKLEITDCAKKFIADNGYDVQYGARPLKRAVQKYVEDELVDVMLDNHLNPGDIIKIDYDGEKSKIQSSVISQTVVAESE